MFGLELTELQSPPVVTTDFVYVRFIGDRSIQEKDFRRIQIDRIGEMQKWADRVKNLQEDGRVKLSIIAANNHYAGFGPGTMQSCRRTRSGWGGGSPGLHRMAATSTTTSTRHSQRSSSAPATSTATTASSGTYLILPRLQVRGPAHRGAD